MPKIFVAFLTNIIGLAFVHGLITPSPRHRVRAKHPRVQIEERWKESADAPPPAPLPSSLYETMTPYGIRSYVLDQGSGGNLYGLWSLLKVETDFPGECGYCTAEVFQDNLDAEPSVETVLRIGNRLDDGWHYQYLIFKQSPAASSTGGWRFVGLADDVDDREGSPQHFVVKGAGRNWMVVRDRVPTASGSVLFHNRVFELTDGGVREVLVYPSLGYQVEVGDVPERSFATQAPVAARRNGVDTLEIQFTGFYFVTRVKMISRQQTAVFTRPRGADTFAFDAARSNFSALELQAVYNSEFLDGEDFLKYNYGELRKLADEGDEADRAWLRDFVGKFQGAAEAKSLSRRLPPPAPPESPRP